VFRNDNCDAIHRLLIALDSFMLEDPALSCLLCKIFLNLNGLVHEVPRLVRKVRELAEEMIEGIEWAEDDEQALIPFMERVTPEEQDLYGICTKLLSVFEAPEEGDNEQENQQAEIPLEQENENQLVQENQYEIIEPDETQ